MNSINQFVKFWIIFINASVHRGPRLRLPGGCGHGCDGLTCCAAQPVRCREGVRGAGEGTEPLVIQCCLSAAVGSGTEIPEHRLPEHKLRAAGPLIAAPS